MVMLRGKSVSKPIHIAEKAGPEERQTPAEAEVIRSVLLHYGLTPEERALDEIELERRRMERQP